MGEAVRAVRPVEHLAQVEARQAAADAQVGELRQEARDAGQVDLAEVAISVKDQLAKARKVVAWWEDTELGVEPAQAAEQVACDAQARQSAQ